VDTRARLYMVLFVMKSLCVLCEERNEYVYIIILMDFRLQRVNRAACLYELAYSAVPRMFGV
jgi:hypothetical protein